MTVATVTEQLLYEIGDPAAYTLPDVVCDWRHVRVEAAGADAVRVSGARGGPRPLHLKLSCTAADGHLLAGLLVMTGVEHARMARAVGDAVVANCQRALALRGLPPLGDSLVEVLGAGGTESVCRVCLAHDDPRALAVAGAEIVPAALSMGAGIAGLGAGRAQPMARMRHYAALVPRALVEEAVEPPTAMPEPPTPAPYAPAATVLPPLPPRSATDVRVPLVRIAYGRSGDKGDSCNVGLAARSPALYAVLLREVTAAAVGTFFFGSHPAGPQRCVRFELPGVCGVNFTLTAALGGGGGWSLRYDRQAKVPACVRALVLAHPLPLPPQMFAQRLLVGLHVHVPPGLLPPEPAHL